MKKVFLALVFFAACNKPAEVPSWVIPENKMVSMLVQIHIAEARVSLKNLPADSSNKYFVYLKEKIYAGYKIDSSTFKKSFRYYANDAKQLDKIYASVVDSLSLRETLKKIN